MRAQKVYENLSDILKPKSEEDIEKDIQKSDIKTVYDAFKYLKSLGYDIRLESNFMNPNIKEIGTLDGKYILSYLPEKEKDWSGDFGNNWGWGILNQEDGYLLGEKSFGNNLNEVLPYFIDLLQGKPEPKIYEALGDIFKGKDIEELKPHLGLEDHDDYFKDVLVALAEKGYILNKMGGSKSDYENNDYQFRGKRIVAGDAVWVKLRAAQELEDMDFFWNDSFSDEDPSTDSMMHITKLEDGTYVIDMSVNLRGVWKSRNEDSEHFNGMKFTKNPEEIVPIAMQTVDEAESFLENQIDGLKVYGQNW